MLMYVYVTYGWASWVQTLYTLLLRYLYQIIQLNSGKLFMIFQQIWETIIVMRHSL